MSNAMKNRVVAEKWEQIDSDLLEVVRTYIDENVKSAFGEHGEFFQIMEDVVLPILASCNHYDIINDKHLDQHIDQLREHDKQKSEVRIYLNEMKMRINSIEGLVEED